MNRGDLTKMVARKTDLPRDVAEDVIVTFLDLVALHLAVDEEVLLRGFGKFQTQQRPAVTLRNPHTKEPIEVGPRRTAKFVPSPVLKERLNCPL